MFLLTLIIFYMVTRLSSVSLDRYSNQSGWSFVILNPHLSYIQNTWTNQNFGIPSLGLDHN